MNTYNPLKKSELEIMEVLWNADHPMTHIEINKTANSTSFTGKSIFQLLSGLEEKGMITVAGVARTGVKYSRTFLPAITAEEYTVMQLKSFKLNDSSAKIAHGLVSAFVDAAGDDDDDEILDELEELIRKRKESRK